MISSKLRAFNSLYTEITAVYHDLAVKLGITDSAATILYVICSFGDSFPLGEICRRSGLSKQTANSAIRKLEQEGIVYLQAINGKSKMVCLTEAGKAYAAKTVLRVMELEDSIYDEWTEEELGIFMELNQRFLDQIKKKTEELR